MEFLGAEGNFPFVVALLVMLAIGLLETMAVLLGAGISSLLESLLPEMDVDAAVSAPEAWLDSMLGWLHVGRVPILILLVTFLTGFGLVGLMVQELARSLLGAPMTAAVASVPASVIGFLSVRFLGGIFQRVLPQDETDAVSEDSLVGRMAFITIGTAAIGHAAEAKVRDEYGTTHYVMVVPELENETLSAGSAIILVRREGAVYHAIRGMDENL